MKLLSKFLWYSDFIKHFLEYILNYYNIWKETRRFLSFCISRNMGLYFSNNASLPSSNSFADKYLDSRENLQLYRKAIV